MSAGDRWDEADRLFRLALELPAAERGAFVARLCGDDPELRFILDELLRATDEDRFVLAREGAYRENAFARGPC